MPISNRLVSAFLIVAAALTGVTLYAQPSITVVSPQAYIEDDPPTTIGSGSANADTGGDYGGGSLTVTYTGAYTPGAEDDLTLATTLWVTISGSDLLYDSLGTGTHTEDIGNVTSDGQAGADLIIVFSSAVTTVTAEVAEDVLQAVTYANNSDAPDTSARTIEFTLNNGTVGDTDSLTLNVTAVNDAPALAGIPGPNLSWVEDFTGPLILAGGALVTDDDVPASLNGGFLRVDLGAGGTVNDLLQIETTGASPFSLTGTGPITVNHGGVPIGDIDAADDGDGAPLQINFNTANATLARIQDLARFITFDNLFDDPDTTTRTASFRVDDGTATANSLSNIQSISIDITETNDAPVLNVPAAAIDYFENDAATLLAPSPTNTIVDIDSPDYDGGRISASIGATQTTNDQLTVETTANVQVIGGTDVQYDGGGGFVSVGTIPVFGSNESGQNGEDLVVFFNAASSQAAAEAILNAFAYRNISEDPSGSSRIVTFECNDGDTAGGSNQPTRTVNVLPVNDIPTFTRGVAPDLLPFATTGAKTVPDWAANMSAGPPEEELSQLLVPGFIFTLVNTVGTISVSSLDIDEVSGELTFSIDPGADGIAEYEVRLQDNGGTANGGVDTSTPIQLLIAMRQADVYVDSDWSPAGGNPLAYGDVPPGSAEYYGIDAFDTVQEGLDHVATSGTVHVLDFGANGPTVYSGAAGAGLITRPVTLDLTATDSGGSVALDGAGVAHTLEINGVVVDILGGTLNQTGLARTVDVHTGASVSFDATTINHSSLGTCVLIDSSSLTMTNSASINHLPGGNGFGLDLDSAVVVSITDCALVHNGAGGDCVDVSNSPDVDFINTSVTCGSGGRALVAVSSDLDLNTTCTITQNGANTGVDLTNSVVVIDDCTITQNAAGTALLVNGGGSDLTLQSSSTVLSQTAGTDALVVNAGLVLVDGSTLDVDSAGRSLVVTGGTVTLDAATVDQSGNGIAIDQDGGDLTLQSATSVTQSSANILISCDLGVLTLNDVDLNQDGNADAVDIQTNGAVDIDLTTIDTTTAGRSLVIRGSGTVAVDDTDITQTGDGVGLRIESNATLTTCTVNQTGNARAVEIVNAVTVTLDTVDVDQSSANNALFVSGATLVTCDTCTFDQTGGATNAHLLNSTVDCVSCDFTQTQNFLMCDVDGSDCDCVTCTFVQDGNEDAILIRNAGDLSLDDTQITESSTGNGLCILLANGILDCNAGAPNTFSVDASGRFIENQTAGNVDAENNAWFVSAVDQDENDRAGGFAIEDRILHAIDDAARGFVRVHSSTVFVTDASQLTPGSIQRAVNVAISTVDTIEVEAATYPELVVVNKELTLRGQQFATDGPTRFGGASAESIVTPPGGSNPATDDLFTVSADNVLILGFLLDGDNGAIEARHGVTNSGTAHNLQVVNTIAQNLAGSGVDVANGPFVGSETPVNTQTNNTQRTEHELHGKSVAMDAAGNFVVVWSGIGSIQDPGTFSVFAQRFNAAGVAQGPEIHVNTTNTALSQWTPTVGMDSAGNFVVAWATNHNGFDWEVMFRLYDSSGAPQTGEVQAASNQTADQRFPSVFMRDNGEFVLTWSTSATGDTRIAARRFDATGTPINLGGSTNEFQVNTSTTNTQVYSDVAMDGVGNFAVTWQSNHTGNTESYFRTFDNTGAVVSGEVIANTVTAGNQANPSIAMGNGTVLVAWTTEIAPGQGIAARRFDLAGNAIPSALGSPGATDEFTVNTNNAADQLYPAGAIDSAGNFTIVWESNHGGNFDVFRQSFDNAGTPDGGETPVNTTTGGDQRSAEIAVTGAGAYAIAWTGPDASSTGIFAVTGSSTSVTAGSVVGGVFDNCAVAGVAMASNAFLDVDASDFILPSNGLGVSISDFGLSRGADTDIENSTFTVSAGGTAIELRSLNNTSDWNIGTGLSPNSIDAASGLVVADNAVAFSAVAVVDSDVRFDSNTIGASGGVFARAVNWHNIDSGDVSVEGGSIDNADIALVLDSASTAEGAANADSVGTVDGVDIGLGTPGSVRVGVLVRSVNPSATAPTNNVRVDIIDSSDILAAELVVHVLTDITSGATIARADAFQSILESQIDHALFVQGPNSVSFIDETDMTGPTTVARVNDGLLSITQSRLFATVDGLLVENFATILEFTNNEISGVTATGVFADATSVLPAAPVLGLPPISYPTGSLFSDNSVTGAPSSIGLNNQTAALVDATDWWWGSMGGPDHATNFGPAGRLVVSNNVRFSPWWASGTDVAPLTPGWQGGTAGSSPIPGIPGEPRHAIPTRMVWDGPLANDGQPQDGTAGLALSPEPSVRAEDASGILGWNWNGVNSEAFLVFSNNPTGASLQGQPVIQGTNGYAVFNNVNVSTGGIGFVVFVIGHYGNPPTPLPDLLNPNSPLSDPFNIDNFFPQVSTVTPNFVHEGAGSVLLQVDDNNPGVGTYNLTTVVRLDGSDRPTFFVNPKRLLVSLTASDTANPQFFDASGGTAPFGISVHNPSPGGGTTNALAFTVNDIPDNVQLSNNSVLENSGVNAVVGNLSTTDTVPAVEIHGFTLEAGVGATDNGSFNILGNQLRASADFNFEVKSSYSVRIRCTDSLGAWVEGVFVISVTDVNETPTAVADSFNINEDNGLFSVAAPGVLGNDTDPDSGAPFNTLNADLVSAVPPNTTGFVLNPNGSFSFTPDANFFGMITFDYRILNGGPISNTVTVTITVASVNDAPSVTGGGAAPAVNEDSGPVSVPAFVGMTPGGGAPEAGQTAVAYTVNVTSGASLLAAGPSINPSNGELTYTPAADANGVVNFTVTVQDNGGTANGGVDTSSPPTACSITINAVNDAPSMSVLPVNTTFTVNEDSGSFSHAGWSVFSAGPTNESGQTVSDYNINILTGAGLFSSAPDVSNSGNLTFTPGPDANGTATFEVTVTDNGGGATNTSSPPVSVTINILPVNDAPSVTGGGAAPPVNEDSGPANVAGFVGMNPGGGGFETAQAALSYTVNVISGASLLASGPSINTSGDLSYTPSANANGTVNFTVTVRDDGGVANGGIDTSAPSGVFSITIAAVNDAPSMSVLPVNTTITVNEDSGAFSFAGWSVFNPGPADESGQLVSDYNINILTGGALFSAAPDVTNGGTLTFTPGANSNGTATFEVTVTDNGGGATNTSSPPVSVTVNILPVNDAPIVTGGSSPTVNEDAGPQSVGGFSMNSGAANETQGVVAFTISNLSLAGLAFTSAPAISPAGDLTFESAPNSNGSATFQVRVQDDGGTANGGVDTSALSGVFTITVTPVNDAPSFSVLPGQTTVTRSEDSGLTTISGWASFSPGPANESGQSVVSYNVPAPGISNPGLFAAPPAVDNSGNLTFTPALNANGSSTFDVSVTDNGGGTDTSATQTFTIIITPVNDAPTLTTVAQFPLAAPLAVEDTPYSIPFADMQTAANEADVDLDPLSFRIDSLLGGTLTMNGNPVIPGTTIFSTGSLVWTPPSNQNGVLAAFTILAWDGLLASASPVTVSINVDPANDDPFLIVNNGATVVEFGSVGVTQGLLEVQDAEQGPGALQYTLQAAPLNGSLVLSGFGTLSMGNPFTQADINNGDLTYNHSGNELPSDTFSFFVSDGAGGNLGTAGSPLVFAITVTPVNDAPTLNPATLTKVGTEDVGLEILFGDLDTDTGANDVDGNVVGFRVVTLNTGTLHIDQTGTGLVFVPYTNQVIDGSDILRWTPPQDANGTFASAFTVEAIDDGTPGSATSAAAVAIEIDVNPVNDTPSISVPTPAVVAEDTAGSITINAWAVLIPGGGSDENGQATTATFSTPTNLSNPGLFTTPPSVASPSGDLSFELTPNAFGTCSFDITVNDGGAPTPAVSAVHNFSITVTPVNDEPTISFISTIFGGPEDSTITVPFAILQGAANEADIDSSPVNFLIEPVAANGTAELNGNPFTTPTVFTVADTLEWFPTTDANGTLIGFNVRAWDGALQSTTVLPLRIFVEPVNDEPDFAASNPPASLEDAGQVTELGWATFDAGPPNEDTTQAVLSYTVSSVTITSGTLAFLSGPTIDNNGNLHYEAAPNTNGTATFMAEVRDTGGTASLGDDTSPLNGPFTITVTAVNDAPDFSTTGNPPAVNEDSGAASVSNWASVLSFGPADENAAPQAVLDYLIDQISNSSLFLVDPDVDNSGNLTYTPAADAFGTSTFRVRLQDNGGAANGGVDTSAGQTFTITVNPVNDAPSVTGGSDPTVAEDAGAQSISNYVGINPGPANESGQAAVGYTVNVTSGGGLLSSGPNISPAGELTFTPAADANGTVDFTVTVQDNGGTANGGSDTSAPSGTFTITITPVNDAPTLTTVTPFTGALEDTAFTITYAQLESAADEADIDSTPVNFRVEAVTNGTLTKGGSPVVPGSTTLASGESWVWTPAADDNGTLNAFTVTAWDGSLASTTPVQVQVQVTAVNDEPSFIKGTNITVAWDQGAQTIPGWASSISEGPADESTQNLTFNIVSNNNTGLFSTQPAVSSAGTLTFTPNTNVSGTASISLELMDDGLTANGGDDTSPTQSFTITITTAGEIDVDRGTTAIGDGTTDTVGAAIPVLTPLNLTYTITNSGNGLLQLTNTTTPVVVLSTVNADAWITHQPTSTLVTTTSSDFVVHIVPLTAGFFSVDLTIDNTDANEDPYDILIDGTAVDAPDIGLERGFFPNIPAGSNDALGVIPVAIPTGFTYVVRNDGTSDLTFGSPAVSTSAELNCSVAITAPVGPITPSSTENLVIDVTPTVTGVFSFILSIDSNDPDEDPFTVFVSGVASANSQPELELFGRNVLAPMDTENVGLIPSGSNTTFLYEVRNVGAASLTVTNPVLVTNPLNCVAVVTIAPGTTVAPGNLTVLGIDVQPIAPGPFQFDFELITNDTDESPLPVTVIGQSTASVAPEIAVDRDGTPIASGGTDDIGDLPLNVYSTFVYRIRNEGTSTLNVNRPVTISGESNCEVLVWTFPDVNVAPQDDSLLIVGIRPLATGAIGAIISISNNDSNEGNYLLDIIGTGPEADIRVESPEFTPIASGDPLVMTGGKAGSINPLNLWVRNLGTGDLNIVGVSTSGEVNCTAAIVSSGTTPVTPGTATTMTIDVTPTAGGAYSFTLTISTNDPDTGNYVIFVSGNAGKSGGGGGGGDEGCSTSEGGSTSWLLLLAALSALTVATRSLRTRN